METKHTNKTITTQSQTAHQGEDRESDFQSTTLWYLHIQFSSKTQIIQRNSKVYKVKKIELNCPWGHLDIEFTKQRL